VFEEEEPQCLSKDSILSYVIAWQLSLCLFCYCIKLMGTPFLRIYLDFYPQSLEQPCLINVFG
jgi:hypothetical protein